MSEEDIIATAHATMQRYEAAGGKYYVLGVFYERVYELDRFARERG